MGCVSFIRAIPFMVCAFLFSFAMLTAGVLKNGIVKRCALHKDVRLKTGREQKCR